MFAALLTALKGCSCDRYVFPYVAYRWCGLRQLKSLFVAALSRCQWGQRVQNATTSPRTCSASSHGNNMSQYAQPGSTLPCTLKTIRDNQSKKRDDNTADTGSAGSAEAHTTWSVRQARTFRGYSEAAMKQALQITRLTLAATKGLPEILLPSLVAPMQQERFCSCSLTEGLILQATMASTSHCRPRLM